MGTGIGAESYSLVEQGKIDLILSSKPEDRRLIFDEAAGVTKYKSQKREALRRLEDTENNLLRINDIVAEVKRQIGSLERQAAKARRYKEVLEQLKDLETKLSSVQISNLNSKIAQINESIQSLESTIINLTADLEKAQRIFETRQKSLNLLNEKTEHTKAELVTYQNFIIVNNQRINLSKKIVISPRTIPGP